jgi:hypothetical protein
MQRRIMHDGVRCPMQLPMIMVAISEGGLERQAGLRRYEVVRLVGQFGGRVKLGSGCCQAASFSATSISYASLGVRPPSVEWGRRVL